MTVLVTGGSGLVGINLVERLLSLGNDVVSLSATPMPLWAERTFASLAGRLHVYTGDVRNLLDWDAVAKRHDIGSIVHCAAITPKEQRERRDFHRIVEVNVLGTVQALDAARRWQVRRFIYCSSGAVYGANAFPVGEIAEAVCPWPQTLYAVTKHAGEGAALRYGELWNLDVVVARLGAVFGRWEHDTGVRDMLSAPMQTAAIAESGGLAVLPREGLRDWIYGPDVAKALVALLEVPKPKWDVYNVGPGVAWSMVDWCELLRSQFPEFSYGVAQGESTANVDFHVPRDRSPLCIARIREDLGFQPEYGLQRAFDDFIDWRRSTLETSLV
jgi:nucleoside-diphosphate-sugar epimerase